MNRIAVIGGGAAGLMSAGAAAESCSVILFEKNDRAGKKLGISGKGRCNVTNNCGVQDVLKNIPRGSRFLQSAVTRFPPEAVMSFFESLGVPLKTERGGRVFPVSDRAEDIVSALEGYALRRGVEIIHRRAERIETEGGRVKAVTAGGKRYPCDCALIATGGVSYRATGSDGWGHREAKRLGHTVTELRPSLVPLESDDAFCAELAGVSLKNTGLKLISGGKTVFSDFGELLFTHFGLSGPMALTASAHMETDEKYEILLDLKPALSIKQLDARILRDFEKSLNKSILNTLGGLMPKSLIPVVLGLCGIEPSLKANSVTREHRGKLVSVLKELRVGIKGFRPINEAIITSGGVSLSEIVPATMQSKLISGLFFAGEVIDADAYTGGYNLQIAWSTALAAANGMIGFEVEDG